MVPDFTVTAEQKERARCYRRIGPPGAAQAEDVAKHLGMRFLYSYGYDYASTHVHPMANDGILDFFIITKLKRAQDFPDQRVLLSNTVLTGSMIVQQALNARVPWRGAFCCSTS